MAANLTLLEFEKTFDNERVWEFTRKNHSPYIFCCVLYVLFIFSGRKIMEKREKFNLSPALALWSLSLALFSIVGSHRAWTEITEVLVNEGFYGSVCVAGWAVHPIAKVWACLFFLSKVVELGDTVFIVLRKQQLIFLHWYHHVTVLLYCLHSYSELTSVSRWFMSVNFIVHAFMYSYYALRALKVRVPNQIRMAITLMQLAQMIIGCLLNVYVYYVKRQGRPCETSYNNLYLSLIMYFSYFVLFAKFFYDSYIKPKSQPSSKPSSAAHFDNNNKVGKLD